MTDHRLAAVTLDETSVLRRTREVEQERQIAIYDLLESNSFAPAGSDGGPYHLTLRIEDNRLVFDIRFADGSPQSQLHLSLAPLRKVVKDYFLICESYYRAIRTAPPSQIESLDAGRRALHDEGAGLLKERLDGKVATDDVTARRLFTLVCVLHMRV
jgi:uncharacterized protein (UPF0262 family)